MNGPVPAVGCVVMASGLGRRFQVPGAPWDDKLLADFLGVPLIGRALDATDVPGLAVRTVVTRSEATAAYCWSRGADVLTHSLPHRSDTVRLGLGRVLELAGAELAGCMFCPADQPLLTAESVQALLLSFAEAPERIHRLCWRDRPGSPVIFPWSLFGPLQELPAGRGGAFLIEKYPEQVTLTPVRDGYELCDVDTREELARLAAERR